MKFSLQLIGIFIVLFTAQCTTKREPRGRNRMKRQGCQDGFGEYKGQCCKLCQTGSHVDTCSQNNPRTCETCEHGSTYLDHPNLRETCERCKSCDPKANLEAKEDCTVIQNTVCTCKKGYYCDKELREECNACHSCKKCEGDFVIEKQCTSTNDTVCKKVEREGPWWIAVIFLIFGIVGGVGGVGVWLLKKQKRFCFDKRKEYCEADQPMANDEDIPLKGIDLIPHLNDIVGKLGLKLTKQLARGDISDADIEFYEQDAQNDAREISYKILKAWCEMQGLEKAAPNLIKRLKKLGKNALADKIMNQIWADNKV